MGAALRRPRKKSTSVKVLIAGLDSAGKTTILHRLKLGPADVHTPISTMPTLSFNSELVDFEGMQFSLWDVGGQDSLRTFWRHHFTGTQAVVYVVDSNDTDRIQQSGNELREMMASPELRFACLLVLANKSDLPYAARLADIRRRMRLEELKGVNWHLEQTSARKGDGLLDAMQWLRRNVKPLQ